MNLLVELVLKMALLLTVKKNKFARYIKLSLNSDKKQHIYET